MSAVLQSQTAIQITKAAFQHEEDIYAFHQRMRHALDAQGVGYFLKGKSQGDIANQLKNGAFFLATQDTRIIGSIGVIGANLPTTGGRYDPGLYSQYTQSSKCEINALMIDPQERGTHLSHDLMRYAETWARKRKIQRIFARIVESSRNENGGVLLGNMQAYSMFSRRGYQDLVGTAQRENDPGTTIMIVGKSLEA